jgi:MarR family transcriptional regulator, negative regulator of the multidrug operon emrRAB
LNSEFNIKYDPNKIKLLSEKFPQLDPQCSSTLIFFVQTAHEVYNGVSSRLSEYGLSVGNLKILMPLLLHDRPLTPSELADYSRVTRSTVTSVIDKLERDGVIQRSTLKDRRMTAIHLTEAGKQLMTDKVPLLIQIFSDLLSEFTDEDHARFAELLQKLSGGVARVKRE